MTRATATTGDQLIRQPSDCTRPFIFRIPAAANRYAVVNPAMPAPTTQTSVSRSLDRGGCSMLWLACLQQLSLRPSTIVLASRWLAMDRNGVLRNAEFAGATAIECCLANEVVSCVILQS